MNENRKIILQQFGEIFRRVKINDKFEIQVKTCGEEHIVVFCINGDVQGGLGGFATVELAKNAAFGLSKIMQESGEYTLNGMAENGDPIQRVN